jgi:dihydroorotase
MKSASDRDALLTAVAEHRIDVVATDHAPHTWAEKQSDYLSAPAGLPLVQDALPSLFVHVEENRLSLERLVEATAHAPAQLFQVKERGFIREGYYADLVLVDRNQPYTVMREDVLSKCGWSPFEAITFPARIVTTIVNGHVVFDHGKLDESTTGSRLIFDR